MRLLFLAYYHKRYMLPMVECAAQFRLKHIFVREMYAADFYKEDVLTELAVGRYDYVVYFGHGAPGTWIGYGSIGKKDFGRLALCKKVRALLSFCCYGFMPDKTGESLCSLIVKIHLADQVVGYYGKVLYENNLKNFRSAMDFILKEGIPDNLSIALKHTELIVLKAGRKGGASGFSTGTDQARDSGRRSPS